MKEVVPRVYIGDADDARRPNALVKAGITRVLTVHTDSFAEGFPETTTHNMLVQATDTEETDLLSRFQDCIDFIEAARQEEVKVLVHCNAGVSRSATVVMAFVMQKMQMDCPAAFRMIKGIHRPAMCVTLRLSAGSQRLSPRRRRTGLRRRRVICCIFLSSPSCSTLTSPQSSMTCISRSSLPIGVGTGPTKDLWIS